MHMILEAIKWVIENGPWAIAGAVVMTAVAYFLILPTLPTTCTGFGELEGIWGTIGFSCGINGRPIVTETHVFGFVAAVLLAAGAFLGAVVGEVVTGKPTLE